MPTNLPPEAIEAEKRFRAARSTAEKIASLEEYISAIPKHKGTDKLRADLRHRLSKLKSAAQGQKKASHQDLAYHIDREGAGQVVVVGPANVGKSALVDALTNATPEVSDAPFTTWNPTPGMMLWENIQIQLIDTPPLNRDYMEPALLDLIRRSDLILLVIDLQADPLEQLEEAIALLEENHIVSCHRQDRYPYPGGHRETQRLIFIPFLVLVNKWDDETYDEDFEICCALLSDEWPMLPVSAATGRNLARLKQAVFERLEIIRVYTKPPGKEADLSAPFILPQGSTVEEFAGKVHRDFVEHLKSVRVWGSAVYDGQMVGRDHVLQDGDVVELRL
jgi:ribosome-interacting GTPase 1